MDVRALDRLGDEIAELSVHLDAATARLLDLIREFDVHGGWKHRVVHHDLGADYFERRDPARLRRHHVRRLEQLGYDVVLVDKAA